MNRAIAPLPHYAFMAWCSVKNHRDGFTFYSTESYSTTGVPKMSPTVAGNIIELGAQLFKGVLRR
jgi:hypothetical protein